jgi:cyclophilin family peptidyl-prolyl cis-trans isomerase
MQNGVSINHLSILNLILLLHISQLTLFYSFSERHGKGPFTIIFTLLLPGSMGKPNAFEVELAPLVEMPHTVFTVLNMIQLRLFDKTSLVYADSNRIKGGSPNHATTDTSTQLIERYEKFGLRDFPLGFKEYIPSLDHQSFTLDIAGDSTSGPTLIINLTNNSPSNHDDDDDDKELEHRATCFGRIISGFETLNLIQNAPKGPDGYTLEPRVEIQTVRLQRKSHTAPSQVVD